MDTEMACNPPSKRFGYVKTMSKHQVWVHGEVWMLTALIKFFIVQFQAWQTNMCWVPNLCWHQEAMGHVLMASETCSVRSGS